MNLSKHLYIIFLLSILVPGLILGYLSFRTVKDERILIEKSLENKNEEFVELMQQLLAKTKDQRLSQLQDQLRLFSSKATPDNYLFLATDLLENAFIQSLVVFHKEEMVLPRKLASNDTDSISMHGSPFDSGSWPADGNPHINLNLVRAIQLEYAMGRYLHCLRLLRQFFQTSGNYPDGPLGTRYKYGLRILELKCLVQLNLEEEAEARGRSLIHSILQSSDFRNYHQVKFYLNETVNLLTSLENLPRETRDYLWSVYQKAETFLVNAEFVSREWKSNPEYLIRYHEGDIDKPMQIHYYEAIPYLIIGYPWTDKETRVIARLNETVFTEAISSEILQAKKSPWKDVDFVLLDQRDRMVLSTDSVGGRSVAMERKMELEIPSWRILIFKKGENEVIALGRRKLILLYSLLGFSLIALILGSFSVFVGLKKERRVVKMKSNFLSAVSHELKTPLTAIRMFAEILESGRQTQEEKRKHYAQLIGEESQRLHNMIEGILNFTRLEEKRSRWNFTELDLNDIVRDVSGLMTQAFDKAGINLSLKSQAGMLVMGDFHSLRSVVQNLLENSLKYSKSGTTVSLWLEKGEDKIILRVKDQGIGIPSSDLKRIFDKFYRAGDEMTRKTKGSGLGLAIVKQILDYHRAQIKVFSKVDEGTEMVVSFNKAKPRMRDQA